LTKAPLLRIILAQDNDRWLMIFLSHHLIMDHTTLEVILEEIAVNLKGNEEFLPPPVPFRNFVAQARRGLSPEAHEAFFRNMLGDITTPTAPFDLRDVHGDGSQMVEVKHELPTDLALRMRQQVRCMGATPAALCHLAWALVLSRCCNQEDVVFGTVLFGRMQGGAGIERALGMFINTLPLRITCDKRTVAESLHETQQKLLALMRHEHASLSLAQRCNAVPAPMPLFSALLNYRHSTQSDSAPQLEGVELLQAEERSNFPFSLTIDDLGEGFTLTAQVDLSISPNRICIYMQKALQALVTALENAPQTQLNRVNILPLEEQQQLLIDWNATATPLPESCVHQLFEAQVRATPEATAVVFENESLSYDQLNTRANQMAHHLIDLGVKEEALVAIALERSPAMIVALLAVFKAGGAYVPLDPDYPVDRLTYMMEDCGAGILITQNSLGDLIPQSAAHALYIDGDETTLAAQPQSNPDRSVSPDNLAYVIYTSGSTGKPKGVMIEQRGLVNFMLSMQQSPGFSQQDSLLAVTTISFDIFGLEIYLPLISGGKIVLARSSDVADPAAINNLLLHNSITIMQATPATWRMLVDTGWSGKADLKMLVGGEALLGALAKKMLPLGNSLWNLYGPTETTIWSSLFPVANENTDQTVIPIGRPIANTQLYILDRHDQPTPVGVPGELHIGGAGLARGYLNRPELTAEKFIPDPFSDDPGARLYKTGDLVRYRDGGNIEFLGRLDHQVKIRGFRIELGEIEAALAGHPHIREAVVVARTEESGEKRLVAYLVADGAPEPTELRAFLKLSLPDYMLPAAFMYLEALPLTPNGKVDRKAFPEPEARLDNAGYHLPRDSFEQHLIEIWESVLSVRPIGINDNFFDIGGHSLLVVRLITEMNKKFRKHLPISRLFEFPTIAGLASLLRQDGDMPAASCLVKIRQQGSRSPLFVLPGASGMTSYLYPFAHHLDEDIPFFAFQAQGLEGKQLPHTDFAEMVTHYVDLLREVQPTGPYFLAGHSFGALVAFAMAQRLLDQGQDIGMLYILDTPAPTNPPLSENNWLTGEVPLIVLIGQFLYVIFDREITFSKESVEGLNDQEQLTFIARQLAEANLLPKDDITDHLRGLLNVFKTQLIMQNEYLPESYVPLPITLFRAKERMMYLSETETYDEDMGWGQYSSHPVQVHYVPGNHVTMMTLPEVKSLAALMTSEMRGLGK
jgi:amino acid adenylation domain-containing protein